MITRVAIRTADEPLEDREYPDEADLAEREDEQETLRLLPCPACGELVCEQAQQCPHCKEWILPSGGLGSSRKWYVRGGLYLTRTLLLNWLFWLGLMALVGILALLRMLSD